MSFTIVNGFTTVTLEEPSSLVESVTKSVQNLVFNDGTDVQLNRWKVGDDLTLGGIETSSATASMEELNTFMDDQVIVTVAGLPDDNLNTDYRIRNLSFIRDEGMVDQYNYSITLERVYDRL